MLVTVPSSTQISLDGDSSCFLHSLGQVAKIIMSSRAEISASISEELAKISDRNMELLLTFGSASCDSDIWPWGNDSLHISWYENFVLFNLRETKEESSNLIVSMCVQFSLSRVTARSPLWKAMAATLENESKSDIYSLVSEYLDKVDHETQTLASAAILFQSVQEEFSLSMDELHTYTDAFKGYRVILEGFHEVAPCVKALEKKIGIPLPEKVLRFESHLVPSQGRDVALVKLDTIMCGKAVRWEILSNTCVYDSENNSHYSIAVGNRRVSIGSEYQRSNTLCRFHQRSNSSWDRGFQYICMSDNETPYKHLSYRDMIYHYLTGVEDLNTLLMKEMRDVFENLDPFLEKLGIPASDWDNLELLDGDCDLTIACGDLTHSFEYSIGKLKHLIYRRSSKELLAKLTVTDISVDVQLAKGFPYTLHYSEGIEVSSETVLRRDYELSYPEPLYRKNDVWVYENCLHSLHIRHDGLIVYIDDRKYEKDWTDSPPDCFCNRMACCPSLYYQRKSMQITLPKPDSLTCEVPRLPDAFLSVEEALSTYSANSCEQYTQGQLWKYVQKIANQHGRSYPEPNLILRPQNSVKLPIMLRYATCSIVLSGDMGQLLEVMTETAESCKLVTKTVILPQFTQISVHRDGELDSIIVCHNGVEKVIMMKGMRKEELCGGISKILALVGQKYRCTYPEGWTGKWTICEESAVYSLLLIYPNYKHTITQYTDSLTELIDFGDYKEHIRRCGNNSSHARKDQSGNIQEVGYKRLPTEENGSFIEMNVNNKNELQLKTKYSKLWQQGTYGYKAVKALDGTLCIAKLLIPEGVRVASNPRENTVLKMRAECAIVVAIWMLHADSKKKSVKYYLGDSISEAYSCVYKTQGDFVYTRGGFVLAKGFDPSLKAVCVPGIHYAITQEEALAYHNLSNIEPKNVEGYEEAEMLLIQDEDILKLADHYGSGNKIVKKLMEEQKRKKTRTQRLAEAPISSPSPTSHSYKKDLYFEWSSDSEEKPSSSEEKEEKLSRSEEKEEKLSHSEEKEEKEEKLSRSEEKEEKEEKLSRSEEKEENSNHSEASTFFPDPELR